MKSRYLVLLLLPLLTACGPIWGQMMKLSEGVKRCDIVAGRLDNLKAGSGMVVSVPFAKRPEAYTICRNDDAIAFAENFKARGYRTALTFEPDPDKLAAEEARLRSLSAAQLQAELQLAEPPALLLFGTLLTRETTVAPLRGVVMEQSFRLEFLDLVTRQSTIVEVAARTLAQDSIAVMVEELLRRARG